MKKLFLLSALIELGAGLALLCLPSQAVALLLGSPLGTLALASLGRLAGAALFALGVACWFARLDVQSRAAHGLVMAMSFYNFGAVAILGISGV